MSHYYRAAAAAPVVRFPMRHAEAIWVVPEKWGGTYVVAGDFGDLYGSLLEALAEARKLARTLRIPVRGAVP